MSFSEKVKLWFSKVFGTTTVPVDNSGSPPWMDVAKRELGVHETKHGETARIIEYHSASTGKFKEDEIPWCASFVNWVFDQCKIPHQKDGNDALASSYDDFGIKLDSPKIGCVVTFRWSNGGRHVAFCSDFTSTQVKALGGNQADLEHGSGGAVTEKWQNRSSVVAYRWPIKK